MPLPARGSPNSASAPEPVPGPTLSPRRDEADADGERAIVTSPLPWAALLALLTVTLANGHLAALADEGTSAGETVMPEAHLIPNCARTGGGIAIAEAEGRIYYCLQRVVAIERRYPGASKFFFLHEYGHIALQSGDELLVDCWSAHELSHTVRGEEVLTAARRYIEQFKLFIAKYGGTGADRSELLAGCYAEGLTWLERARAEGRRPAARVGDRNGP